jgi:hypothetical protein
MIAILTQIWASLAVVSTRLLAEQSIADGWTYITQASTLQCCATLKNYIQYGLYPAFLSFFDFHGTGDWQSKNPLFAPVYFAQVVLLGASSGFLLFVAIWTSTGQFLWKSLLLLALSLLLLSPLVILWPSFILVESLAISGLLLLAACCLCADKWRNNLGVLALVFLTTTALMLMRDPLIFLAVALGVLITVNAVLSSSTNLQRIYVVSLAGLILAVAVTKIAPIQSTGRVGAFFFDDPILQKSDDELRENFAGLIEYRDWLRARGARTYVEFLATHPGYLLRSLWQTPTVSRGEPFAADLDYSVADLFSRPLPGFYGTAPWPKSMASFLLAPFGWIIVLIYILVAATNYIISLIRRHAASRVDMLAMSAMVGLFLSYHSDAWDVWRHTVPFVVTIYLALTLRAFDAAAWLAAMLRRKTAHDRGGDIARHGPGGSLQVSAGARPVQ